MCSTEHMKYYGRSFWIFVFENLRCKLMCNDKYSLSTVSYQYICQLSSLKKNQQKSDSPLLLNSLVNLRHLQICSFMPAKKKKKEIQNGCIFFHWHHYLTHFHFLFSLPPHLKHSHYAIIYFQ